ncbi:hypothetical protein HDA40_002300 [Hamadaea flava]|uniref:DUF4239 domain-containing protein n=1 Tax=Hamadaea flava TaxID=1742688 RepID=A0ABV8LNI8_9ACTN|nr:hypothetical protein [Hamadaea flava]MCP2323793.1 hypothetical protein [Hamadaea flava]
MEDEAEPGHRLDLVLTVVMALAAVGTAWAGFESTKWGGVQANAYAEAGAVRAEAGRAANRAGQQRIRDAVNFTSWLEALNQDLLAGKITRPSGDYTPTPGTLSGFLYERFRPGFEPVIKAWVATKPLVNPNAPATPFDLDAYQLPDEDRAADLNAQADALAHEAQSANQRGDNYVLTAVIFALVLFFAGVAGRARVARTRFALAGLAVVALVAAIVTLATFPVEI